MAAGEASDVEEAPANDPHWRRALWIALAVNAAICRAGLSQRRKTNPVVDGRPVPRPYPTD